MKLTAATRNALISVVREHTGWSAPDGVDWRIGPPKEIVAKIPYIVVKQGYNIGKLGLADIVNWLAEDGFVMPGTPTAKTRRQVSQARLDAAEALLLRHGYKVEKPE